MINLGMILGGGRLIKIINSCLIAEAAYSETRTSISALFNMTEQVSEII